MDEVRPGAGRVKEGRGDQGQTPSGGTLAAVGSQSRLTLRGGVWWAVAVRSRAGGGLVCV